MAIVGLSYPVLAKYALSGSSIVYSEGKQIGHAINYSSSYDTSDDNNLFGDNMIVESDSGVFQSGTLILETSELTPENSAWLLGISADSVSFTPSGTSTAVTMSEYVYDDDIAPKNLGFGIIEKHIINGVTKYRPMILTKLRSKINQDDATTQGENIDWQTKSIEFAIQRDDSAKHAWKIEGDFCADEATAKGYIDYKLGVSNS